MMIVLEVSFSYRTAVVLLQAFLLGVGHHGP